MLWLNKNQSIKNVSLYDYIYIIKKQGFNICKILQYSQGSCVCLTSNNTIVKVLNPSLARYQFQNLLLADKAFAKCGIITPRNLTVKKHIDFYIFENEYIKSKFFLDKMSLMKADKIFLKIFSQLSKMANTQFGPLVPRNFLIPAFADCNYIEYWDTQMEYFSRKISNPSLIYNIKKYYRILRRKIKIPNKFILTHSDISPKHIFMNKSRIGCIDLEEAMYLDNSFMWAIWYARTIHKRSKSNNVFFYKLFSLDLDLNLFNFHIYRELFIQYYYQGLLNYFFRDYFNFLKSFNLFLRKLT